MKVNGQLQREGGGEWEKKWPLSITTNIIFLENIRQKNDIKDILVSKKDLKTSAFAYNIHSKQQLTNTSRNAVNLFQKATDTNYDKTKSLGIWLVSTKDDPRRPLDFKWNSNAIKILGYTYKLNIKKHLKKTGKM